MLAVRTRLLAATFMAALCLASSTRVSADGGNSVTSTDAFAKERADEFAELLKKKDTLKSIARRLEILKELRPAPCGTSIRFLTALIKKSSTSGDERLYALRTLLKMADASTLEAVLAFLMHEKDAALWQIFAEELADFPATAVAAWLTGPALSTAQGDALSACLEALAHRPDKALAERIEGVYAKQSKLPAGGGIASEALRALVSVRGIDARPVLLEAARHPDARVRLAVADRLASLQPYDATAEAALRGLLADESDSVRQTTATRVSEAKRLPLAKDLIALLSDKRMRTRHVTSRALEHLTGQKLGHDPLAWTRWLEKQDPGKPLDLTVPTYHGISFYSDRVVFLVDGSESMKWPWRKAPHRIDVARTEFATALRKLAPDVLFNVVVFSDKILPWKKAEAAATEANVKDAVAWAEKSLADPAGDTKIFDTLEWAFANDPQFDTIFLLTDGNPVAGKYWSNDGILAGVRAWTRHRRVAIHTVGLSLLDEDRGMPNLSESPAIMTALLSSLASTTSGEFREVLRAPAAK